MADKGIAFLAEGKLYLKPAGQPVRLVESQFAQQAADRAQQAVQRNAWKTNSTADATGMLPSALLWRQAASADVRVANVVGVTRGNNGELLFALNTNITGGLFAHNPADGSERRLFHRNHFLARDISRHTSSDLIAVSLRKDDGTANIAVTNPDGRNLREVTEGDSVDESPRWAPGPNRRLIFQSAGVGRNQAGHFTALGPYAIEELDLDREQMKTLAEANDCDYLSPQIAEDGALWFIRRPYSERGHASYSPWKAALDVLLFPFRLARAFVHFFNFFSIVFSQKPLLTAGGPQRTQANAKSMMLWGKMIDAEKAMKAAKDGAGASLVPRTWQLIRQAGNSQTVVAHSVLSYDLCADGGVVYSDGSTIFYQTADVSVPATSVCTGKLIERVISTDSP
jgi:hypothetical protein